MAYFSLNGLPDCGILVNKLVVVVLLQQVVPVYFYIYYEGVEPRLETAGLHLAFDSLVILVGQLWILGL